MKSEFAEDLSFILFLIPLVIAGGYALLESSAAIGYSTDVYLSVTRNPIIFVISMLAISAGTLIEIYSNPRALREERLTINARRMLMLAGVTIVISATAAWASLGATASLPSLLGLFLSARFPLIYAVMLTVLSSVLTLRFRLPKADVSMVTNAISIVALLSAPIFFFLGSTANLPFGIMATVPILLIAFGIGLFIQANRAWFDTKEND